MDDPFGQALLDHYRECRENPLLQCDGPNQHEHRIDEFYFNSYFSLPESGWIENQLRGPLLDIGAGAGRDTLYFQTHFETIAIEISEQLVTLLNERGAKDARFGDMFEVRDQFPEDRFQSILISGTQLGQATSILGLRKLLNDFAYITTDTGTAVIDAYDPNYEGATEMLGYRDDPTPGIGYRTVYYQYENAQSEIVLTLLFSPERLREVTISTDWTVREIRRPRDSYYYRAALEKDV